ncbi:heme NO-binding domain-containing protein [Solicola sp. PLA-1-18]|uniref:heme NO-binding domain-containing protein n=1 Tax=Solicola sp. PLA-1-18 TaxID=3380532 RepID=UPI003B77C631
MKGIIFNLVEDIVTAEHGEDTWDALVDQAGVDGAYTSLGDYPDADLGRLVAAASAALETPADDIVRWIGRQAMPIFVQRYPGLFSRHYGTRSFALGLNEVIHPEVHKLYPGAATPQFAFDTSDPSALGMEYRSARQMCSFAEGLLYGAGDHFGEDLVITQPRCMKRDDDHCLLVVSHP